MKNSPEDRKALSCQTFRRHPPRPCHPAPAMARNDIIITFMAVAVIFDVVGFILFFVGIFAPLSFWDFFVLSGPLLVFLSLFFWIFWYMGNLTVSEEELSLSKQDIL